MVKRQKIYEGKAKVLYKGTEPFTYIQHFKDDVTAFNAQKKDIYEGKGVLNNIFSEFFMKGLSEIGINTHLIKRVNMREQLIMACEIIPLEVVVRNISTGSISKRLGIKEGHVFPRPILEYYYKDDKLNDPLVNEDHISVFEWATDEELEEISNIAFRVNDFLSGLFFGVKIVLVDFKLEFGRPLDKSNSKVVLADEISPDSCRLWDKKNNKKLDKDVFRLDIGNISEAYEEVAQRFNLMPRRASVQSSRMKNNIFSLE